MTAGPPSLRVRPAVPDDVPALCDLLNRIIEIGGTTAIEQPLSPATFRDWFLSGPDCLQCLVAEQADTAVLLGFQALARHSALPADWGDIATFARAEPKIPGVGSALFAATRARARDRGLNSINATIRADNSGGLAYYGKMGFMTYRVTRAVPLADGTPVDRVHKRHRLV